MAPVAQPLSHSAPQPLSHSAPRRAAWAVVLSALVLSALGLVLSARGAESQVELFQQQPEISFVDVSAKRRGGAVSLTDLSALQRDQLAPTQSLASSDPIPAGKTIKVDMPETALKNLKVGSVVKGKVREPMLSEKGKKEYNTLDFEGKVRSLQMITVQGKVQSNVLGEPDEGIVSVKLLSDQYVAPGTAVTGQVAGKVFKGVVTQAPKFEDRLDEAEKRVRELAPPVCDELCKLSKQIAATQKRIADYKQSRRLRSEANALEKRMDKLEHPPPPPETVAILGNWAGFKFELPQGPNQFGVRVEDLKDRIKELPKGYVKAVAPLYDKTRALEHKLDEIEGLKTIHERIDLLKTELGEAEHCAEAGVDKADTSACIQKVMEENKYHTFHGKEAEEEYEKDQFLDPSLDAQVDMGGDEEEEEEEGEGEEGEGAEGQGAEEKARPQQLRAQGLKKGVKWAPGQKKEWAKFLHKTDRQNGISNDEDNVIASWA